MAGGREGWGATAITLHWVTVLAVFTLFGLGLWMSGLDYYHPWYHRGPDLHRGVGVLLLLATLLRLGWRLGRGGAAPLASHSPIERRIAGAVHTLLYLLLFFMPLSGYLISTADGRSVEVFGLFAIPPIVSGVAGQEDIAGALHQWGAWLLIGLALLHGAAALKHHLVDRDRTLTRMLGMR